MQPHQGPLLPTRRLEEVTGSLAALSPKRVREGGQTLNYEAKGGGRSAFVILGTRVPVTAMRPGLWRVPQGTWHPQQAAFSVFSLADRAATAGPR